MRGRSILYGWDMGGAMSWTQQINGLRRYAETVAYKAKIAAGLSPSCTDWIKDQTVSRRMEIFGLLPATTTELMLETGLSREVIRNHLRAMQKDRMVFSYKVRGPAIWKRTQR